MTLGERIKQLRSERGWSITETARRIQGSRSFLYQVERDQNSPSLAWIEKAAAAFGISVIELLAPLYAVELEDDPAWSAVADEMRAIETGVNRLGWALRDVRAHEAVRRAHEVVRRWSESA